MNSPTWQAPPSVPAWSPVRPSLLALGLAVAISLLAVMPSHASAAGTGSISGTFAAGETGPAGSTACIFSVTAYDFNGEESGVANFYAGRAYSGPYTIDNLPPGDYRLLFGYQCGIPVPFGGGILPRPEPTSFSEYYDNESTLAAATPVSVTADSDTPNINASLLPNGSISGRVTDEQGSPLKGVCVDLFSHGSPNGSPVPTNSYGTYSIRNLQTGLYEVQFVNCPGTSDFRVVPEFWNGGATYAEATPIDVGNDSDTPGIDAQLAIEPQDPTEPTIYRAVIGEIKVKGPARVRKGRKVTQAVSITNSGNTSAEGVMLSVKGRGATFGSSVGAIPAGSTRVVKARLKPKKVGVSKLTFKVTSSNAGGKSVKRQITVK